MAMFIGNKGIKVQRKEPWNESQETQGGGPWSYFTMKLQCSRAVRRSSLSPLTLQVMLASSTADQVLSHSMSLYVRFSFCPKYAVLSPTKLLFIFK